MSSYGRGGAESLSPREAILAQLPGVLRQEGARWGFVLRAALAAFMSLWLAMFLSLGQPSTAMITTLVLIQPQSGAVLSKSFYRALGTCAGGAVAVLLFAVFPQQRVLLLAGMCLWVGVCIAGSARWRNARSYGFVLAGYTACIIALPILNTPQEIFTAASMRISEVFVGILCVALTSESIFPKFVQNSLYAAAENCFVAFGGLVRTALSGDLQTEAMERMQLRFLQDVARLDSYGASAAFEAGETLDSNKAHLFNTGFMTVSTSLHALYAFAAHLPRDENDPLRIFFRNILTEAAGLLAPKGVPPRTAEEARTVASAFAGYREKAEAHLADLFARTPLLPEERRLLESGMHLLHRFLTDMRAYLLHYAGLDDPPAVSSPRSARFNVGTDKGIALVSGLRAALVLAMVLVFWQCSDWSAGADAAIFAVVFCGFQAAAPNPIRSILFSAGGSMLGVILGMVYSFMVLPGISDFVPMCAALFPFLVIGPYLMTIPPVSGLGRGYNFMFASFANPGLVLHIDPAFLTGGGLGKLAGIFVAAVMLYVFLPSGGGWWKRRLHRGLLREAGRACRARPGGLLPQFESGVRDILLQHVTSFFPTDKEKQTMLKRALAIGNLGRVIIEIRHGMGGSFSPGEKVLLRPIMAELRQILENPDFTRYRALLAKIQNTARKLEEQAAGKNLSFAHGSAASLTRLLQRSLMRMAEELRMFTARRPDTERRKAHAA